MRLAVQLAVVGLSWDFNKDLERQIRKCVDVSGME